ncbi:hypothetical protein [Aquimarina litoralis]|uniref:hypothetical protein n=1 Tax=Aquimarina litoralis TaxID=584605 RepID=UPI001C5848C2|nr:hypothetical protein [Aquimarina litoralis]MBW1294530.1 hypothetical protein [Aquimarina litoralis]
MKKLSIWCVVIFTLLVGFISCEEIEELENCPDVTINVDNVAGSAVYRFAAQLNGIEDVRLTWSIDGEEIATGNLDDIASQIFEYQFEEGTYTVCVSVASETCPIEVCKEIVVDIDETNPCPDLFFETRQLDRPNHYKFIADFPGIEETRYEWFINGEVVETDNQNADNYLFWEFSEAGTYEVCIKTETPDCPEGTSYCKVIEVEEVDGNCPELFFLAEQDGDNPAYYFQVEFPNADQVEWLGWFINGELVEDSNNGDNNRFYYQFEPGRYEVCLKTETPDCPQGTSYCKVIEIEGATACPELFFEAEQDGDNPAYYFYPSAFEGIDDVTLEWSVNGDFVGTSTGHNEPFYYQFAPGSYEVCLSVETPDCPQGVTFCKVIEIEETGTSCPELYFNIEQEGDTPGYNFWAEFEGMNDISYEWTINGDVVDSEILDSNERDDYLYYQFGAGTYEICIIAETPDCPNGVIFCKTLVVE